MSYVLSEQARRNKVAYNIKRNNKLTKLFCARLNNIEYNELCEFLNQINMNKAEFVRWAFDKLKEDI